MNKKIIYTTTIVAAVIGLFFACNKTHATNNTGSNTNTGKVGRVENIKIIRKSNNTSTTSTGKVGRVENIKIIRKTRAITDGVNNLSSDKVVIIKPQSRDHVFISEGSTAKKVSQIFDIPYVINGSYFWKDEDGDFHPAGTLGTNGKSSFDKSLCNDVNLCGIYNLNTLQIEEKMSYGDINGEFRSSGPLLMRQGNIVNNIKNNISHWQRKTQRTALINTPSPYFIYTTTGMTLYDFTSVIKKYFSTGSAINLDGGSSTSFYSNTTSFNSSKILPEFFLLK